jgi:hypothetical protein
MSTILRISAIWSATAWPLWMQASFARSITGSKLRKLRIDPLRCLSQVYRHADPRWKHAYPHHAVFSRASQGALEQA